MQWLCAHEPEEDLRETEQHDAQLSRHVEIEEIEPGNGQHCVSPFHSLGMESANGPHFDSLCAL